MYIRFLFVLAILTVATGLAVAPVNADCCGGDPVPQCPPICSK
jgi:hypothetical protein